MESLTRRQFLGASAATALALRLGFVARPALYTWRGETVFDEPFTRRAIGLRAIIAL